MIKSLTLTNLLSFGPEPTTLQLGRLSILIGPNGCGKSNLVEAISLLRSAPEKLVVPVRDGGGVIDWLFKDVNAKQVPIARIEAVVERPQQSSLRYKLSFTGVAQRLEVTDERVESEYARQSEANPYFFFGYENGRPMLNLSDGNRRYLRREEIDPQRSILSQRNDPDYYPELAFLAGFLKEVRLYRDWEFGRFSRPRLPQKSDLPNDFLQEDCANLGLVLNSFRRHPQAKKRLLEHLRRLYEGIEDVDVLVEGGSAQIFLLEEGRAIPATRLSDGTLRYLCLLAVLCHPKPPPLVCIEEPELGLHPDLIPTLADLLKEASEATQLVVTTHSENLVDAFHDDPECVVVCGKERGATTLQRLDKEKLKVWLDKYRLGQLWSRGDIGGTRW
jgi:predicted ATPase